MHHVLSARQFSQQELVNLFTAADKFYTLSQTKNGRLKLHSKHKDKVIATLFYEPSTRTRLSFEAAALKLGAGVISTENAKEFSSAMKGETIEDTIKTVEKYADIIVLRHFQTGAALAASHASRVPIINAGDGKGDHPTQALLDLYTIFKEKGKLDNLTIVIGGDLAHGRTARSLAQLISLFNNININFVSTAELRIGSDIKTYLTKNKVRFRETDNLKQAVKNTDVVYWTRLQKERLDNPEIASSFVIDQSVLQAIPNDAIIMHPLPRVDEIAPEVDSDPRAAYFRQAENGLYVRMALIDQLLY